MIGTSAGQSYLTQKLAAYLSDKIKSEVAVGKVDISFFNSVILENVYIEDLHGDTLVYLKKLDAGFRGYTTTDSTLSIYLGAIEIEEPTFFLRKYKGEKEVNMDFIINAFSSSDTNATSESDFVLTAPQAILRDVHFIWDDENVPAIPFGIDWDHIEVFDMDMNVSNLNVFNDEIKTFINAMEIKEKSGFHLRHFSGDAIYSDKRTSVVGMKAITNNSDVEGDVLFRYKSATDYADFNQKVRMNGVLHHTKVSMTDIAYFAPDLKGWHNEVVIEGKLKGRVSNMSAKDLHVQFGDETIFKGSIDMNGLPNIDETFMNFDIKELITSANDIRKFQIPPYEDSQTIELPKEVSKFGKVHYEGQFTGFVNDFVSYGDFKSDLGMLKTDVKLARRGKAISFDGELIAERFKLGKLLESEELFNEVTMHTEIHGEGEESNIEASLKGKVDVFDFYGYRYKDISVNGNWANQIFKGLVNIRDRNLELDFNGEVNLSEELPQFKFYTYVCDANLFDLNILKRDSLSVLNTGLYVNFKGNSINNVIGRAEVQHFNYEEGDKQIELDKMELLAYGTNEGKVISLQSKLLDATISGIFNTKELPLHMENIAYNLVPNLFQQEPQKADSVQLFNVAAHVYDINQFTNVFYPDLKVVDSLNVLGEINTMKNHYDISVYAKEFVHEVVSLNDLKLNSYSTTDSVMFYLDVKSIDLSEDSHIRNFSLIGEVKHDLFDTKLKWDNQANKHNTSGDLELKTKVLSPDHVEAVFESSTLTLNDTTWYISDSNLITIQGNKVSVDNLKFLHNDHFLGLDGVVSENPADSFSVSLHNFTLDFINPLLPDEMVMGGMLDGETFLSNLYNEPSFQSDITIDNFSYGTDTVGSGELLAIWLPKEQKINLDFYLAKQLTDHLKLSGSYYPAKADSSLDLNVVFNEFPLSVVETFLAENVDQIRGKLSGKVGLSGSMAKPDFNGTLTMDSLNAHVVYLNSSFKVDYAEFFVMPDLIGSDQLSIKDEKGNIANTNVTFFHKYFDDIQYSIELYTPKGFKVMDIEEAQNDLFYGLATLQPQSIATVETGANGLVNIELTGGVGKNTNVFLPLGGTEEVSETDYIQFVDHSKKKSNDKIEEELTNLGMTLDMNLDVTDEAEIQLIFDKVVGDIIKAKGNGNISMSVSENGDLGLNGAYTITEGEYLFTLESIINKKFTVENGSTIRWSGDPFNGQSDIVAVYRTKTSVWDLGIELISDQAELKRKIYIDVLLKLTGNYMQPNIEFAFRIPNTKFSDYEDYLNNLENGDQNLQVVSLLMMNKFVSVASGGGNSGGNALGNNVSELLSNQVSNFLSGISQIVDIGVNYRPGDNISSNQLELALSTQLLDDRISVETNFGVAGTDNSSTSSSSSSSGQFIGDFKLEYKISEDGKVKGTAFYRSDPDEVSGQYQGQSTQGAGILYREDFETFANFWCRIRKRFMSEEKRATCDCTLIERERLVAKQRKAIDRENRRKEKNRKEN